MIHVIFVDDGSGSRGSDGSLWVHDVAGDKLDDELASDDGADGGRGVGLQRGGVRLHSVQVHASPVLQVRAAA